MSHGCGSVFVTIATAYDTLGEDGLAHSFDEPKSVGEFTNAELLPTLFRVLPKVPTVNTVVYDGEPEKSLLEV
jgi:long-chain acyl-CoA synthetase